MISKMMSEAIQLLKDQSVKASHICNEFYAQLNGWTVYRRNGRFIEASKLQDGKWSDWYFFGGLVPDYAIEIGV